MSEYSTMNAGRKDGMRSIHIYCDGGFGNRYNGLVSGLLVAKAAGLEPIIIWPRNNWCGSGFSELFENDYTVIERELASYLSEKDRFHFFSTEDDHLKFGVPNKSPLLTASLAEALMHLKASDKDVFFSTPLIPAFFPRQNTLQMVRELRFCRHIIEAMERFIQEHQLTDFLGVQIRKTDFGANGSDDNSLFELVAKCPQNRFFVCSDDSSVEQRFKSLANVVIHNKRAHVEKLVDGGWNSAIKDHSGRVYTCNVNRSAESVEDAVVDLLILSRSQIVRTSNSTFLNTALLLKEAEQTFLQEQPEKQTVEQKVADSQPNQSATIPVGKIDAPGRLQSNVMAAVNRRLPITVVAIDTDPVSHPLTRFAVKQTLLGVDVQDVLFFGGAPLGVGERFIETQRFDSIDTYSEFVLKCLWPFVNTEFILIIHWDGFVVNPVSWCPEFLDYDYIGAPWAWMTDEHRVGNGGFSLRSRRLLMACRDTKVQRCPEEKDGGNEDVIICRAHRTYLESMGIRFAPVDLAEKFSYETGFTPGHPFGFHGAMNMPNFVPEKYLIELAPALKAKMKSGFVAKTFREHCVTLGYNDLLKLID
jgi:hypothetical protein